MPNSARYTKGGKIAAASLNKNAKLQTTKVVGGKGVRVSGQGQEIVITQTGSGGRGRGGLGISRVATLPAIPTSGYRVVYHTVQEQWFSASAGDTYWTPLWDWTSITGAPGT